MVRKGTHRYTKTIILDVKTQGVREFHGVMQVILYAVYRNNKSGSGAGGKMYGDATIYGKQVADGHHDEG
ncbi:hypothetical protein QYE76_066608 [Lolium multiflorum]|uniref:Uncharacterized protein n=1 Tax=Lolium multiflorum TaxID=4521 RepID=A0AAD8SBW7_LOLMU|nr:hypothetical protein QYE76_066608 [Lolium multiflorum]